MTLDPWFDLQFCYIHDSVCPITSTPCISHLFSSRTAIMAALGSSDAFVKALDSEKIVLIVEIFDRNGVKVDEVRMSISKGKFVSLQILSQGDS